MRWLVVALLLGGCDALFQLDHLSSPPGDAGVSGDSSDAANDASRDATSGRTRYVQGALAVGSGTTVQVMLGNPQSAENLNVLFISWNGTSSIGGVSDDLGNTWIATTTTINGNLSQIMYYAADIKPGINRIRVTFNGSVNGVNMRALEYAGIDPLDPFIGSKTKADSAMIMVSDVLGVTTPALLVAGFATTNMSISPGPLYIERLKTGFGYAEDREVAASGSYDASATQGISGAYVAHVAAFATL